MQHVSTSLDKYVNSFPQKEKEPKRKSQRLNAIGYRLKEGSTETEPSQPETNTEQMAIDDGPKLTPSQLLNHQIDLTIDELTRRGWIAMEYRPWHFKAAHRLGLQTYNQLAISVTSAREPQKLLVYKIQGALLQIQARPREN